MKVLQQDFYQQEIKRCNKLYSDFKEASSFIDAVFKALSKYLNDHPEQFELKAYQYDEKDASDQIRGGESLALNPKIAVITLVELLQILCDQVVITNPKMKDVINAVSDKLEQFQLKPDDQVSLPDVYQLRDLLIKETALEQDMATFLFSLVLSSIYRRQLEPISEVLRTDLWEGGNCPLCGEKPHFGLLRSDDGAKHLECWLCGTKWLHTRIKCPFCNHEEQEDLGYFTAGDSVICRVHYCNQCCQYYKIFDARKFHADGEPVLTIHNLASLGYDLMAKREGYSPGSGLEWVNEKELSDRED